MSLSTDLKLVTDYLATLPGVTSATTDPNSIRAPGIWLRVDSIDPVATLSGERRLALTAHLVVPDNGHDRSLDALDQLLTSVFPALCTLGEPGAAERVGLTLPATPAPLPALAIPVNNINVTT